jgi:hypothetical protein
VLFHADAFRIATGQQARPRWGADRAGDHEVGQLPAGLIKKTGRRSRCLMTNRN